MRKVDILGVVFDNLTVPEATEQALRLMSERRAAYVAVPDSELVLKAGRSRRTLNSVKAADMVLPGSMGIIYASRILGLPLRKKISGRDFVSALLARLGEQRGRVFLLAGNDISSQKAAKEMQSRFAGISIADIHEAYISDEAALIEQINASQADLLLVSLPSPRQEIFMYKNAASLDVGLIVGVGGLAEDFSDERAAVPKKWSENGLEWLYRLKTEPEQLKRIVRLPEIIFAAIWHRLFG